ncbi:hypothetical protein HKK72_04210 [Actinomadura sp. HBU206391]|nr:hypothetical protein [Actinomadura sp. HBU206391]
MEPVTAPDDPAPAPRPAPSRPQTPAPLRRALPTWRTLRTWPTGDEPGCRDLAVMVAGFGTFILIDCVMMYAPFQMKEAPSLLPQLLTLLLLAFGLGGLLVWHVRGAWRPFGIGLMLGWVFMTLVSAGFLTGLNP